MTAASRPRPNRRLHALVLAAALGPVAAGSVAGAADLFLDVTAARGVDFEHRFFPSGDKHMPENMGPGVAILDYDQDGDLDLYFVQGAPVTGKPPVGGAAANRLLRQEADGRFVDVTAPAGVGDEGVGMGVAVGDYDGDGAPDLYVTNYGPNVLYRNRGDGTFEDVTRAAGVGGDAWSTGAAFVDLDQDGDLDLYVAAYLAYDATDNRFCGNAQTGLRAYCHPDVYGGARDSLYLNEGDGTFRDLSAVVGLMAGDEARGLGVAPLDLEGDGRLELYVANDTTANHLYAWDSGTVREQALLAGLAVNGSGRGEASMGLAWADFDGDGAGELVATHLDEETNTLYRPLAPGVYADATEAAGLGVPSLPWVGFGVVALDVELDGDVDLLVANGHIIDNIAAFDPSLSHRQPMQLLLNDGSGHFAEAAGLPPSVVSIVGRGLAAGDLDRDGDQDLVMTQNGGPALVLDNASDAPSLSVRVRFPRSAAWGGRWLLEAEQTRQTRWFERATSYLSQSAPEMVFAAPRGAATLTRFGAEGTTRYRLRAPAARLVFPN